MKATWTKVYSGPGYPIDPQRDDERKLVAFQEYSCRMILPRPIQHGPYDFLVGRQDADNIRRDVTNALMRYRSSLDGVLAKL